MAVTRAILEGRWARLQAAMRADGLDALVIGARGVIPSFGFLAYVAGWWPMIRTAYAVLPVDGEPVVVCASESDRALLLERGLVEDVRSNGESDWRRTGPPLAQCVAEEVSRRGARRVGVVGLGAILPVADHATLVRELPGVELVDGTALAQGVKAIKEPHDVAALRSALALATEALDEARTLVSPGLAAQDVVAELERVLRAGRATELLVFVDSGPYVARRVTSTVFAPGDLVSVLIEVANEAGAWVELGRLLALGELSDERARLADACHGAFETIRARAVPGATAGEVAATLDDVAAASGLGTGVNLGHGIGVDHDLPGLVPSDATVLAAGHVLSVHPNLIDHDVGAGAVVADALLVGDAGGAELLSGVPLRLETIG